MTDTTRGLPRAREVLDRLETLDPRQTNFAQIAGAMSAQAQAIALVELASATQLSALTDVLRMNASGYLNEPLLRPAEREHVEATVRALLGFGA